MRKLFEFLKIKGLPGHSKIIGKTGNLVKYGTLLQNGGLFDATYPEIASHLRNIHDRRNKIPGSHPYDSKGGTKNKWLTRPERDTLASNLRVALNEVSTLVEPYI